MKNFIKLTSVMLFVCSPLFVLSQTDTTKRRVNTRIDNWRYWQDLGEQGIIPLNPEIRPQPIIDYRSGPDARAAEFDSPDILIVSGDGINQAENSVFVNPIDNQIALNGNNSFKGIVSPAGAGANAMFTFDGGLTWIGGPSAPIMNSGDPAVAIDLDGNGHLGYIRSDYFGGGQAVRISTDDGMTWGLSLAHAEGDNDFMDKNHLWIDNSPVSVHEGNIYSAWTVFADSPAAPPPVNDNQIVITRSADDGLTWSDPVEISSGVAAGNHNQGVNIQTGPNGEVYVTWAIYDTWVETLGAPETAIGFCKSTDGGATFSPAVRIVTNISGLRGTPIVNPTGKNQRTNSYPVMACDISGGIHNGDLYITWSNLGEPGINIGPDVSVYMIRSTDGGTTWSTPTRVNQDPVGNIQYFPWITSDPETGHLHTIFYDDRNVEGSMVETWVASSANAGATWSEIRVSDVAFTPAPIPGMAPGYMGDYLGIAARGGKVYPVWSDNRTGQHLSYTSPFVCGCFPELVLTTEVLPGAPDHQEAGYNIIASNNISSGGEAIYHAGDEVLMKDGFASKIGSTYRAYIEGCTTTYTLAPETGGEGIGDPVYLKAPKPKLVEYFDEKKGAIELAVFPNPTSNILSVQLNDGLLLNNFDVKIYSMSQGLVAVNQFNDQNTNSFQIDISEFAAGVYFIEIVDSENEKVYTSKVIKK